MKKLRILSLFLIVIALFSLTGCSKKVTGDVQAKISVTGYGTMTFTLCYDKAPETVQNFVDLAESGFYDGLTIHRIVKDFVIQGGDPTGTGMGGSDETINGEFSANGVDNDLSHTTGVISMARSSDYNSATSQFFIVTSDDAAASLDGLYAAFGYMTDGFSVLSSLNNAEVGPNDYPNHEIVIDSVTIIR